MRGAPRRVPLAGPMALFLLGGLIGLAASYDPPRSAPWLLWLAAGAAIYCGITLAARSWPRLTLVAAGVVAVAAACGALLIIQHRHLGFPPKFGLITRLGELLSAPFPPLTDLRVDPNAAASFLAGALPLAAGLAAVSSGIRRAAWLTCAGTIGGAVLLTGSRGAWAALAAILLGWGLTAARHSRLRWGAAGALAGAGAAALVARAAQPGVWGWVSGGLAARAADRLALYHNSLLLALDFPLTGIGPGATFGLVYSHFQLLIPHLFLSYAHNLLLGVWLAQGIVGLVGFCALLLGAGRQFVRGLRAARSPHTPLLRGAVGGCGAVVLHGLTDAPQYGASWPTLLISFGLLGVAVAAAVLAGGAPPGEHRPRRGQALALTAALALAAALGWRPLLATASANAAAVVEARAALAPGLAPAERGALLATARRRAEEALRLAPDGLPGLKRLGMLALQQGDYDTAADLLARAERRAPTDQSIRKALGYAYVWGGRTADGARLLAGLDRAAEARDDLRHQELVWGEGGRPDLAARAGAAAALLDELLRRDEAAVQHQAGLEGPQAPRLPRERGATGMLWPPRESGD